MDRVERVRQIVDEIVLNMTDKEERRCAYLHLYGVSQACALLAVKRKENIELAVIAGMLHDIYSYAHMDTQNHAQKSAKMARGILESMNSFSEEEISLICTAIYHHSDKSAIHTSLDEVLKDADVMQHVLYNPLLEIKKQEQKRYDSMKEEFGL